MPPLPRLCATSRACADAGQRCRERRAPKEPLRRAIAAAGVRARAAFALVARGAVTLPSTGAAQPSGDLRVDHEYPVATDVHGDGARFWCAMRKRARGAP